MIVRTRNPRRVFSRAFERLVSLLECALRSRSDVIERYVSRAEDPAALRVMFRVFNQ